MLPKQAIATGKPGIKWKDVSGLQQDIRMTLLKSIVSVILYLATT